MKTARILCMLTVLSGSFTAMQAQVYVGATEVDTSSIVTNLDTPWEILWGPDDHIWFTERYGRISRVDPETGNLSVLLTIDEVYESGESGLLGMVLHPDFSNNPYVYVVYTYLESTTLLERLVRYTYSSGILNSPFTLLEGIPAANAHDGSRLLIDQNLKLFMTTGDARETSLAQDLSSLNGKVLRLNLDGSIPDDNPFSDSYVWTWGHRNPQGLVIAPSGIMYSSEHGPSNDDEVNIIEKGRNYGWPDVEGFCNTVPESQFCADSNVYEPIAAWTPTLAVAGIDYYSFGVIPEWQNSLLITSLKESELTTLKLSEDGRSVVQEDFFFDNWFGRLRDICVSPDGRIYLAVSNRDGRGTVRTGDDRIVEISAVNADNYCYGQRNVVICKGASYDFNGRAISEPGTYTDTITQSGPCDSIVSVHLYHYDTEDVGLEDTVWLAVNETVTLTANPGFASYRWNNGPLTQSHSTDLVGSDLGIGIHDYVVEVETVNGCIQKDTLKVVVSSATAIGETEELRFSVYPNPFGEEGFQVDVSVTEEAVLRVYDPLGRELVSRILQPSESHVWINFQGEPGIYHLVLSGTRGSGHLNVVKR